MTPSADDARLTIRPPPDREPKEPRASGRHRPFPYPVAGGRTGVSDRQEAARTSAPMLQIPPRPHTSACQPRSRPWRKQGTRPETRNSQPRRNAHPRHAGQCCICSSCSPHHAAQTHAPKGGLQTFPVLKGVHQVIEVAANVGHGPRGLLQPFLAVIHVPAVLKTGHEPRKGIAGAAQSHPQAFRRGPRLGIRPNLAPFRSSRVI